MGKRIVGQMEVVGLFVVFINCPIVYYEPKKPAQKLNSTLFLV